MAKCARTACEREHQDCRHTQTGQLYCESCAAKINRAHREMTTGERSGMPDLIMIPRKHTRMVYQKFKMVLDISTSSLEPVSSEAVKRELVVGLKPSGQSSLLMNIGIGTVVEVLDVNPNSPE